MMVNNELLNKKHYGLVTYEIGDQIEVTYEDTTPPVRQVYNQSEFSTRLKKGDAVEAQVIIRQVERRPDDPAIDTALEKIGDFQSKAVTGIIKF